MCLTGKQIPFNGWGWQGNVKVSAIKEKVKATFDPESLS